VICWLNIRLQVRGEWRVYAACRFAPAAAASSYGGRLFPSMRTTRGEPGAPWVPPRKPLMASRRRQRSAAAAPSE
jgi:hypothetical protein